MHAGFDSIKKIQNPVYVPIADELRGRTVPEPRDRLRTEPVFGLSFAFKTLPYTVKHQLSADLNLILSDCYRVCS